MSDEEYCDLETLELLLDGDDCDESPRGNSNEKERNEEESSQISQEMEDFLNAMSEESDDDESGKTDDNKKDKSCERRSDANMSTNEKERMKNKNKSPKGTQLMSPNKSENNRDESSTTQALQKQLLMMQKKMEEMQKMLLEQQNKNTKPSTVDAAPLLSHSSNKMKLIMDDEEDPFFNRKEGSTQHKKEKSKRDAVKTSKTNPVVKAESKAVTAKEIFGDSDSDWDDLDGDSKSTLNEQGKGIKRLLKARQSERQAHKPNFILGDKKAYQETSWKSQSTVETLKKEGSRGICSSSKVKQEKDDRFSLQCNSSSTDQSKPQTSNNTQNEKVVTEDFSRIRIINPLVSSAVMRLRMDGRKLINVSKIYSRLNTPDLQGDWVTFGAVVGKTNARTSNSGKTYSIWKLNDLHDLDNSVSFFLFGEVHKNHWKLDVGTVIGLLNPNMMEAMEKGKSEPAFTIKNPNQLMVLGQSKDLGWCIARTKKGNKCSHFINKTQGDFCSYHVQSEYKKTSAKRLELQGSVTGIKPKSFEQKIFSKNCAYMYGGQSFSPNNANQKLKKSVSLTKLQQNTNSPHRINTLSLNNIVVPKKSSSVNTAGGIKEDKDQLFVDMLSMPTPGSMNLVAHMKKIDHSKPSKLSQKPIQETVIQSVSARDLLKQHKQKMNNKIVEKRKASDLLLASDNSPSSCDPLKQAPVLGRGLNSGQEISFMTSPPTRSISSADRSKLKAISLIQNKGGINKEDPNAVRKQMEPKQLDSIKKRLHSDDSSGQSSNTRPSSSHSKVKEEEPPRKKSRLLGDVDLNSAEVKSILKAKSKHKGALAEAEAEREEAYFSELEKKERMEEKLQSISSIEISVYTCKQCKYTAQSALPQCKAEQHNIVKTKAKKRFFACKKCKERTTTITSQFPTDPCKKCGNLSYVKTSMYKERSGPKLESEILSHRGDEMKFINSLNHKVYLNTVVDKE